MYSRILIPVDGSDSAEHVLPYARVVAKTLAVPVELMEVVDLAGYLAHIPPERAAHIDDRAAEVERSSREYLQRLGASFSGAPVTCTIEKGRPAEVIIERASADKTTLIAMATHGRSGVKRWLLGSIAEKVLRGATNPLLLVRANEEKAAAGDAVLRSIIVPLDGSALAESALPVAVQLARILKLDMVLFRAYELPASAYYGKEDYLPDYDDLTAKVRDEAGAYLTEKIAAVKAEGVTQASSVLVEGTGPDEIIEYARKSPDALITMCTHGWSGVKRWVLGSVTEKVVRHSGDPVLVVRAS
jgi:nucleotide-binding universal stress UspA family protein